MPTNTRNEVCEESPLKTTFSSIISTPVKKLRKMILPAEEVIEEEEEETDQPQVRENKEVDT